MPTDPCPSVPESRLRLALPDRRRLLWTVPAVVAAFQGCGGGSASAQSVTPAPAPAPSPAPAPFPAPSPAPAPAPVGSSSPTTASGAQTFGAATAWAARPSAAASAGQALLVSDIGVAGSLWLSNGTAWSPVSNPLVLVHRYSNARMDGSVGASADVLLDSWTIPAYTLGATSGLRITAAYGFPGGGTASKAPQIRAWFGTGSYAVTATALLDTRGQFATQKSLLLSVVLQNENSMSVNQVRPIDYAPGVSGNAYATVGIDFTQDVTIGFGALNNAASASADDQQVLHWFQIELIA